MNISNLNILRKTADLSQPSAFILESSVIDALAAPPDIGAAHGHHLIHRCWISDDGIQVTSRLLETKWGKVEHAAITVIDSLTFNGENDLPWAVKMEIKKEMKKKNLQQK